jgi:hypothetical protein
MQQPFWNVKGWQPPLLNELEMVATIIDQRTSEAAPWMPINRGIRERAK